MILHKFPPSPSSSLLRIINVEFTAFGRRLCWSFVLALPQKLCFSAVVPCALLHTVFMTSCSYAYGMLILYQIRSGFSDRLSNELNLLVGIICSDYRYHELT